MCKPFPTKDNQNSIFTIHRFFIALQLSKYCLQVSPQMSEAYVIHADDNASDMTEESNGSTKHLSFSNASESVAEDPTAATQNVWFAFCLHFHTFISNRMLLCFACVICVIFLYFLVNRYHNMIRAPSIQQGVKWKK